ncbi:hypothetical protein D3C71_1794940 [compost metagenome]
MTRLGRGVKAEKRQAAGFNTLFVFQIVPGNLQRVVHFHHVDNGAAHVFAHFAEVAIQLAHLQAKTALDNGLQATVTFGVIRVQQGHHLVLVRQDQALGVGHFHYNFLDKLLMAKASHSAISQEITTRRFFDLNGGYWPER